MHTIAAYSSHFGEVDMDLEWYKEAEEQKKVVENGHYSMDHAIQDRRVGHNHGLVADEGPEGDMERLVGAECGTEKVVEVQNHMERIGHTWLLVAVQVVVVADNIRSEGEYLAGMISETGVPSEGSHY